MTTELSDRKLSVDEFMKYAGWETRYNRSYVQIALNFFQSAVPAGEWRRRVDNPGPWLLPRKNAVRLCEWMQSIDFNKPVIEEHLWPGQILKKYSIHGQTRIGLGNFFTLCDQTNRKIGIYSSQNIPNYFEVTISIRCLRTSVSDAYADWGEGLDPEYCHGGGLQVFIWKPEHVLKRIEV
jgi:hypothetical protein